MQPYEKKNGKNDRYYEHIYYLEELELSCHQHTIQNEQTVTHLASRLCIQGTAKGSRWTHNIPRDCDGPLWNAMRDRVKRRGYIFRRNILPSIS